LFTRREIEAQLALRPAVQFFLDPCGRPANRHYHARNCAPACFFLSDDGLCRIQTERGFDAKPETCRLFPFNRIFRVGSFLLVMPHQNLCPLEVVTEQGGSDASDHELILAELQRTDVSSHITEGLPSTTDVAAVVEMERRLIQSSRAFFAEADFFGFVAAQIADRTDNVSGASATLRAVVTDYIRSIECCLGVDGTSVSMDDASFRRTLIAISPVVRAHWLFPEARSASAIEAVTSDRAPFLLLALFVLGRLAMAAGMSTVTYQSLMRIVTDNAQLISLLGGLNVATTLRTDTLIDVSPLGNRPTQVQFVEVLRALRNNRDRSSEATLGEILGRHSGPEGLDRVVFLKLVAQRLAGKLQTIQNPDARERWRHPRVLLQHWLLTKMSTPSVVDATF
jgi:hypothetical protein